MAADLKAVVDMRRFIAEKLDGMKSVTERDMLRDVVEDIFIPMYDHLESEYARLESRVKEEMPLKASSYVVWSALMERENASGGCPYMFPMLEDDLHKAEVDLAVMQE